MKAAVSLAGAVLLSRAPAAAAVGEHPTIVGSRAPPMTSSWTKAPREGRRRIRNADLHRDRPPEPLSTTNLAAMLRGGWLGVDLVQEIAKAYLKPPAGEGGEAAGGEGGGKGAEQQAADGGGRGKGRRGRGGGDHGAAGRRVEGWDSVSSRAGDDSAKDGAASAGTDNSGGDNGAGTDGGERSAGGAIQGQMERLRLALQQQTGGNGRESGGEGGASGSGGARDSHRDTSNTNSGHRSSMASKNTRLSVSGGLLVDHGANSNVETQSSGGSGAGSAFDDGGYSTESAAGEDEQSWGEGGEDLDSDDKEFFESGGGTEGEDDEEEEELARAKAAAAAARARSEVALLREMETVHANQQGMGRPGEPVVIPPLGQHTRTVVTQAMPARFVEEVGASLASAMALATARMLIQACVNLRVKKKAEKVAFKDVVGCDEAKGEIKQIVDFLVDPSAYDSLGASRPKGILLVGPPGTGKTLIAKACAGEAGVPFLYACGSEFNGVYVGMGVAAVKRLFAKARKHKKSIIYIDEIDHLGRARGGSRDAGSATQDREATLNQLLSEMDGFEGKDGIVVMASTNRKDMLDDALLRSGRFDMQVDVDRPDRRGREQLFTKYLAPLKLSDEQREGGVEASPDSSTSNNGVFRGGRGRRYFGGGAAAVAAAAAAEREKQEAIEKQGLQDDIAKELADMTPYMTGADVANVCATAGRIAARSGSDAVELEHFSAAVDRVQHGLEKPDREVTEDEKKRTAIHEAGHAVAGWMLPWCDEVVKVSIVWRGNALGFSQTAVVERQSEMREMVLDSVCMTLAGRAAEEVLCGTISGGASSDLRVASRQLYSAITEVGFGSTTGLLSPGHRQLSEKVMAEIDQEVQTLLAQQYQRALALIRTHRDKIDRLSAALLEHNVVHKADLRRILGDKVTVKSEEAAAAAALTEGLLKVDGERAENASTSGAGTAPTEA